MRSRIFSILFFLILAIYCLMLSQFGFENWDSGFVQGFSWRILNGENPYRDFIYIRPPVSAYFHAFFMKILPVEGQHFYFRITGYLLFALQVFLTVSAMDKLFDFKKTGLNSWGLILVGFVVSIHNFFGNPWFTTDGVLFASIALFLMASYRNANFITLLFVAFFTLLSALTKQSFYFVPIVFGLWILISLGFRKAALFGISILFWLLLFWFWISGFTDISTILSQISGHTKFSDLYQVGFINYIQCFHNRYILGLVLGIPFIIAFYLNQRKISVFQEYLKWLSIAFFISAISAIPFVGLLQATVIFFNAVAAAFVYKVWWDLENLRYYFPLLAILIIAFCAGLSLGYPYPAFYMTGLILAYLVLMADDFRAYKLNRFYVWIAIPLCLFTVSMNRFPYRENNIFKLDYEMEPVSPKLKHIYSSKDTFEKYSELKSLIEKYGKNYIVAPGSPTSHYLFDTKNPLRAEWVTNFEINDEATVLIKDISKKKLPIFIEKSFLFGEPLFEKEHDRKGFSEFAYFIYTTCVPVEETEHFYVYSSDELAEFK